MGLSSKSGVLPILIAVGVVTLLGGLSLSFQMSAQIVTQRIVSRIDRREAFYSNELAAWHAYARATDDLTPGDTFVVENGLLRRYTDGSVTYRTPAGAYCGSTQFSKRGHKACLAASATPPTTGKRFTVFTYGGAILTGGKIFRWGFSIDPAGWIPAPDDLSSFLWPNETIASVHGGQLSGYYALTSRGRLIAMWRSGPTANPNFYELPAGPSPVVDAQYSCFITEDGRLWKSTNTSGSLSLSPITVSTGERPHFVKLATTLYPGCVAIDDQRRVFADCALHDPLSVCETNDVVRPIDLSHLPPGTQVTDAACILNTCCLTTKAGETYCFGDDPKAFGYGGTSAGDWSAFPSQAVDTSQLTGSRRFVAIGSGIMAMYAVAEDGSGWAWGRGAFGNSQFCPNSLCPEIVVTPQIISNRNLNGEKWTSITGGMSGNFACGETDADNHYCWGENSLGALGTGGYSTELDPVPVKKTW
ncbi:MAG: hypothetical protein HYZ71_10585 [Deltaproteobacteria bacterium]|nr:hypothetical protein [Deltaproteobacteria bacterium]